MKTFAVSLATFAPCVTAIGVALAVVLAPLARAESFSAGISVNTDVAPQETGLPVYPGATVQPKKHRREGEEREQDGANVELGFGPWGLKVIAIALTTDDAPEKVANFYKAELERMGGFIDCSTTASRVAELENRKYKTEKHGARPLDKPVRCNREDARNVRYRYKRGTQADQVTVTISPGGRGSEFTLVRVRARAPD
jgi:hypothetical protein